MVGLLQDSSGLYALFFIAFLLGIRLVPMLINRLRSKKDAEVYEKVHEALERNTEALREVTTLLQEFSSMRNGRRGDDHAELADETEPAPPALHQEGSRDA